ncbi:MAG: NifB/NifX family molybdenum-iron cluster-binding protein, partial [Acidimicrobiia bacterium]
MVVCVPVTREGLVDPRWGRADRVAIAEVTASGVGDWQEFDVGWGTLHDEGTEGSHHARMARFLLDHHVEAVVVDHMGEAMMRTLRPVGCSQNSLDHTVAGTSARAPTGLEGYLPHRVIGHLAAPSAAGPSGSSPGFVCPVVRSCPPGGGCLAGSSGSPVASALSPVAHRSDIHGTGCIATGQRVREGDDVRLARREDPLDDAEVVLVRGVVGPHGVDA